MSAQEQAEFEPRHYEEGIAYKRTAMFFRLAFGDSFIRRDGTSEWDDPLVLEGFRSDYYRNPVEFTVNGRRWRATWEHDGGSSMSDRAYWDDGWWPTFETPAVRRWWQLRPRWVRLWGCGRIAEAVAKGLIPA